MRLKRFLPAAILLFSLAVSAQAYAYSEEPTNTIIVQPQASTQPTDPNNPTAPAPDIVVKQSFQLDEKKLVTWGIIGTAAVLGFFKIIDLIIERMGNTKKLLEEQGFIKKQVQTLAQNTDQLNRVANPNNPQSAVDPELAARTSIIGTGPGTEVVRPGTDTSGTH